MDMETWSILSILILTLTTLLGSPFNLYYLKKVSGKTEVRMQFLLSINLLVIGTIGCCILAPLQISHIVMVITNLQEAQTQGYIMAFLWNTCEFSLCSSVAAVAIKRYKNIKATFGKQPKNTDPQVIMGSWIISIILAAVILVIDITTNLKKNVSDNLEKLSSTSISLLTLFATIIVMSVSYSKTMKYVQMNEKLPSVATSVGTPALSCGETPPSSSHIRRQPTLIQKIRARQFKRMGGAEPFADDLHSKSQSMPKLPGNDDIPVNQLQRARLNTTSTDAFSSKSSNNHTISTSSSKQLSLLQSDRSQSEPTPRRFSVKNSNYPPPSACLSPDAGSLQNSGFNSQASLSSYEEDMLAIMLHSTTPRRSMASALSDISEIFLDEGTRATARRPGTPFQRQDSFLTDNSVMQGREPDILSLSPIHVEEDQRSFQGDGDLVRAFSSISSTPSTHRAYPTAISGISRSFNSSLSNSLTGSPMYSSTPTDSPIVAHLSRRPTPLPILPPANLGMLPYFGSMPHANQAMMPCYGSMPTANQAMLPCYGSTPHANQDVPHCHGSIPGCVDDTTAAPNEVASPEIRIRKKSSSFNLSHFANSPVTPRRNHNVSPKRSLSMPAGNQYRLPLPDVVITDEDNAVHTPDEVVSSEFERRRFENACETGTENISSTNTGNSHNSTPRRRSLAPLKHSRLNATGIPMKRLDAIRHPSLAFLMSSPSNGSNHSSSGSSRTRVDVSDYSGGCDSRYVNGEYLRKLWRAIFM